MRVGIFSDLHLHSFKPFSKPVKGGINTRSENSLEILIQVAKIAYDEYLDLVCFCGDFFHSRGQLSVPLFNEANKLIKEIHCDVAMIRGQHDLATREFGAPSGVDVFEDMDGVSVLDGAHPYKSKELIVYGCNSDESLDDIETEDDVYYSSASRILLMHTIIRGCKINPQFKAEEGLSLKKLHKFMKDADIFRCFLGDIHLRQALSKRVNYVGCSIQQSFGEEKYDTGITIWDSRKAVLKFVQFVSPKFVTVPSSMVKKKWFDDYNYFKVHTGTRERYRKLSRNPKWNVKPIPPEKKTDKKRSTISLETDHKVAVRTYTRGLEKNKVRRDRLVKLGINILESVR